MLAIAMVAGGCSSTSGHDLSDDCRDPYYRQLQIVVLPLDTARNDFGWSLATYDSIDLDASVRPVAVFAPGCPNTYGAEIPDDIQYFSSDEAIATVHRWQGTVFARSAGLVGIKVRAVGAGLERDLGFLVY